MIKDVYNNSILNYNATVKDNSIILNGFRKAIDYNMGINFNIKFLWSKFGLFDAQGSIGIQYMNIN